MQIIREIVTREVFKDFEIPKEFGDKFEMILLPIDNEKVEKIENKKQYFLSSAYNSAIEDNRREDKILMKYQEENGFCKNVLAEECEDVWNDI